VPNLLLLIPLVIRATTLVLFDIPRFDLGAVRWAIIVTLVGTALVSLVALPLGEWICTTYPHPWDFTDSLHLQASHTLVVAVNAANLLRRFRQRMVPTCKPLSNANALQSIQFLACLVAVYIHVPIAFVTFRWRLPLCCFGRP
jgi:hypothetical protein